MQMNSPTVTKDQSGVTSQDQTKAADCQKKCNDSSCCTPAGVHNGHMSDAMKKGCC